MASTYLQTIKDWKMMEMVVGFIEAKALFEKHMNEGHQFPFSMLRKICDLLYEVKEKHHLIFKKVYNPKKHTFEIADKLTPNDEEINYMNNIGLLFHKIMVARELKYVLDYYEEDSTGYQETKASLIRNLQRIHLHFSQGIDVLVMMLKKQVNNIHLITYFLENSKFCSEQFKMDIESLVKLLAVEDGLGSAYLAVANYYHQSGWNDKAKKMCQKSLKINPKNEIASSLLRTIS